MRALDLFSGVGGLTHGLRGIVRTVAYCEKCPDARAHLERLMDRGTLPRGPVHPDVRELGRVDNVDVVLAGFPCVGYTSIGKRQGIRQPESALFLEVVRIVAASKPRFVFLENVAAIVGNPTGLRLVVAELHRVGYDCQWTTVCGTDVGSPQHRDRWFCLAWRRGCRRPDLVVDAVKPFRWTREPVARMVPETTDRAARRAERVVYSAMGNGVIPDAVRAGFLVLWRGLRDDAVDTGTLFAATELPFVVADGVVATKMPRCGVAIDGVARRVVAKPRIRPARPPRAPTCLVPGAFSGVAKNDVTADRLTEAFPMRTWATVKRNVCVCRVLTARSRRELGTQLRFEAGTPDDARGGYPNPRWILWLMGYDPGYLG